jgi:7-keto-8-aminopelargonate synthetase-like enzyme
MADAVGPSSGQLVPVGEYLEVLSGCGGATLLLDDAHGFGVLGENGRGLYDQAGLWPHANGGGPVWGVELVATGTLAKALGGFGGVLPGTREFVGRARASSHYFDGASPMPSAVAGSTAKALEIAAAEPDLRARLRENVRRLRAGLRGLGLETPAGEAAQVGVVAGDAARMRGLHAALRERGILVPYVPTYSGIPASGVLRIAVFATHTGEQIGRLLAGLAALL